MAKKLVHPKSIHHCECGDRCEPRRRRAHQGHGEHACGCHHQRSGDTPGPGGEAERQCLCHAAVGRPVTVAQVEGDEAFRGRMMAMGIVPGASLSVLQGGKKGPLLLALAGSRFMLDPRSSELITIRGEST